MFITITANDYGFLTGRQNKELFRLSPLKNSFLLIGDPETSGQHVAGVRQADVGFVLY
jgi:hypothetical protein